MSSQLIHIHTEIKVRNKIQHLNHFIFTIMSDIVASKIYKILSHNNNILPAKVQIKML